MTGTRGGRWTFAALLLGGAVPGALLPGGAAAATIDSVSRS